MYQRVCLSVLLVVGAWAPVQAAESYDNCSGFIDSLPTTIGTQGVWCLRQNLATAITSGNAITIAVNNVTIDCNDFKIGGLAAGNASQANGIASAPAGQLQNATVRHCNIRGFFAGVLLVGAGHLIEDNRLDNNLHTGVRIGSDDDNNRVRRNAVYDTGGAPGEISSYGIHARADVIDNTVAGVFATASNSSPRGIYVYGNGSEVRGNQVRGLVTTGAGEALGVLEDGSGITIAGNRISAAAATTGKGVYGFRTTFCIGNTVVNFSIAYDGCDKVSGNLSAP